jgi:hypothetical protein
MLYRAFDREDDPLVDYDDDNGGQGTLEPTAAQPATAIAGPPANESLRWLSLAHNNIGDVETDPKPGVKLCAALMMHPRLEYLDLSSNRLSRAAISSIANGMLLPTSILRVLVLDDNGIDAVPAATLAESLQVHPTLQRLSMRGNRLRSDGAAAFAETLQVQKRGGLQIEATAGPTAPLTAATPGELRVLDLRDNYIGAVGLRALLAALGLDASVIAPAESDDLLASAAKVNAGADKEDEEDEAAESVPAAGQPEHLDEGLEDADDTQAGAGSTATGDGDTDGILPVVAGSGVQAIKALRAAASPQKGFPPAAAPPLVPEPVIPAGPSAEELRAVTLACLAAGELLEVVVPGSRTPARRVMVDPVLPDDPLLLSC